MKAYHGYSNKELSYDLYDHLNFKEIDDKTQLHIPPFRKYVDAKEKNKIYELNEENCFKIDCEDKCDIILEMYLYTEDGSKPNFDLMEIYLKDNDTNNSLLIQSYTNKSLLEINKLINKKNTQNNENNENIDTQSMHSVVQLFINRLTMLTMCFKKKYSLIVRPTFSGSNNSKLMVRYSALYSTDEIIISV